MFFHLFILLYEKTRNEKKKVKSRKKEKKKFFLKGRGKKREFQTLIALNLSRT